MAINLTYDPSDDPETIEAEDQRDVESLEVAEKLQEEEEKVYAGKYKDAEDLEKAYIELQKKLGSQEEEAEDSESEESEESEDDDDWREDPAAQAIFQASNEFDNNGEITEETMEALSEMDSRDLVEMYTRIQNEAPPLDEAESVPLTAEAVGNIQQAVGGEEAYGQLISWAKDNFTPQEIQAYDRALESGNMDNINFALQELYYRYSDSEGYEGEMVQGKASTAADGFRSQAEVVRAMADPRYENDPAYRQDVYEKLERSQVNF